jgi:hypothetical protein
MVRPPGSDEPALNDSFGRRRDRPARCRRTGMRARRWRRRPACRADVAHCARCEHHRPPLLTGSGSNGSSRAAKLPDVRNLPRAVSVHLHHGIGRLGVAVRDRLRASVESHSRRLRQPKALTLMWATSTAYFPPEQARDSPPRRVRLMSSASDTFHRSRPRCSAASGRRAGRDR